MNVRRILEERRLLRVGVESGLNTVGDVVESVVLRQHEVTRLVVLGRADDRQRFGKHELHAKT